MSAANLLLWNPTAALSLRRPAGDAVGRPIAELLADWPSLRSRIPVDAGQGAGNQSRLNRSGLRIFRSRESIEHRARK